MGFKLPKNFCAASWFRLSALALALAGTAEATVTTSGVSPYAMQSSILYLAGSTTVTTPTDGIIDTYTGFKYLNLSTNASYFTVDVVSDRTSFTGVGTTTPLVMTLFAKNTSGDYVVVPIYGAQWSVSSGDPALCTASSANCNSDSLYSGYYFSADYSAGKTVRMAISPKLICEWNNAISGCSGAAVNLTAGSVVEFSFKWAIGAANASASNPDYVTDVASTTNNDVSSAFTVRIQDGPSYSNSDLSCLLSAQAPVYFPGDSSILLYPYMISAFVTGSAITSGAPVTHVVFVANAGGVTQTAAAWNAQSNTINKRYAYNASQQEIAGFTNSTDYQAAFSVQDASGMITGDGGNFPGGFCTYDGATNIVTSEVRGFLSESRCFVATAAFGNGHAPPVEVLREFRDQILLKFPPGRAFVDIYYEHGPRAAEFMLRHPWLRGPVISALSPLVALAWLALHPIALGVLAVGLVLILMRRRQWA